MDVQLLAVPYDSARRGERMGAGPERLLDAGLVSRLTASGHTAYVRIIEAPADRWRAEVGTAFDLAGAVAKEVAAARAADRFPLVLSGNCGPAALGCIGGLGHSARVFWFDAHGDFNTPETTQGGFLDGMSLATLTGRCWTKLARSIPGFQPVPQTDVTLIGARDLDPLEATALDSTAVRRVAVAALRRDLPAALKGPRTPAYLHLDLDVLDPAEARINVYPAPGGLTRADVAWAIETIARGTQLEAAAITAYAPESDPDGTGCEAALSLALTLVNAPGS